MQLNRSPAVNDVIVKNNIRGEWGRLQHGLFLQSGMSYSDDIHTAHAKSAPHPSWMKSGTCDHSFYKK